VLDSISSSGVTVDKWGTLDQSRLDSGKDFLLELLRSGMGGGSGVLIL
jgi:hypothetical protein